MTVEEFYNYCKEHGMTDAKIYAIPFHFPDTTGYQEMTLENVDFGYSEKIVSIC